VELACTTERNQLPYDHRNYGQRKVQTLLWQVTAASGRQTGLPHRGNKYTNKYDIQGFIYIHELVRLVYIDVLSPFYKHALGLEDTIIQSKRFSKPGLHIHIVSLVYTSLSCSNLI